MITRCLLWALHIAAAVAVAADHEGTLRIVVLTLWVAIVPGWSLVAHVRLDVATRVSLAVSTSLALALVVSALLVLVDRYRFVTAFWLLFVLATPGLVLPQFRRTLGSDDVAEDADDTSSRNPRAGSGGTGRDEERDVTGRGRSGAKG